MAAEHVSTPAPAPAPGHPGHPVLAGLGAARGEVAGVLAAGAWSLSDAEARAAVRELVGLRAQADAALLMLVREVTARGSYTEVATSAGTWLAQLARLGPGEARSLTRLAEATAGTGGTGGVGSVTGAGLAAGAFSTAHAQVITRVLQGLPSQLDADVRGEAEELLVDQATVLAPHELARVGRALHETLAGRFPDVDDPADAAAVAEELERAARDSHARRSLSWGVDGEGTVAGRFQLAGDAGAAFITAIEALATPLPPTRTGSVTRAPWVSAAPTPSKSSPGMPWTLAPCPTRAGNAPMSG